jgi:cellobiose phosphorylase
MRVENPDAVTRGVCAVVVDGGTIERSLLPVFADGRTHKVVVTLGGSR